MKNVACVRGGVVVNVIVVDDLETFLDDNPHFSERYDALVPLASDPGSPGIGWGYVGESFSAPEPTE